MKMLDKFFDVMGFSESSEEMDVEDTELSELSNWKNRKTKAQVLPFSSGKDSNKVVLLEPLSFDDCQQISDDLRHKRTVIINLESIDMAMARRVIDFVGGTVYAIGGCMRKVGSGIIVAAPSNVDVSGDITNISQPKEVFAWISKITNNS
ncbi:MAG: cell division protein SepF [Clostridia bacterium]|nr:cell division protein SepF [Clostridia bacterium]MDD4047697.1 cell division protein SepF [Clostridia bacterium]